MGDSCCNDLNDTRIDVETIDENDWVCYCEKVSKKEIINAIKEGAHTVKAVADATGACKSAQHCEELNPNKRCCAIDIMQLIKNYQSIS